VDRICNPGKYRGKECEIEEFARKSDLIGARHYFSWLLLAAGAALIVMVSAGRAPHPGGLGAVWIILAGCVVIIAGFGLLLRRRSL
jgi:hypothetical protein